MINWQKYKALTEDKKRIYVDGLELGFSFGAILIMAVDTVIRIWLNQ
jgi:hypothetical protein